MKKTVQYGVIPITFNVLAEDLAKYKSPRDKIANLEKKEKLIRLKRGMYITPPDIHNEQISKELISNHLYGPSYVSCESALSYYGLIPERLFHTKAVTTKRKREFKTQFGNFEYITVPMDYYPIGISQKIEKGKYAFLIASPIKAVCDAILTRRGLRLQSQKAISEFLTEDLRIDLEMIDNWDIDIVKDCIQFGYKKTELRLLHNYLNHENNF